MVTWKKKSNYIGKIVLTKAATAKAESLRIYESKWRGSEEDNTTFGKLHNTSFTMVEGVETNVPMGS